MNRTEIITRLCEMTAEFEGMKQLEFLDSDEKGALGNIGEAIHLLLEYMQIDK